MHTKHKIALILAPALTVATLSSMATEAYASSAFKVTVKMSKPSMTLGTQNTATGTVSPNAAGKVVKVYVHYTSDSSGEYHYVGSDTLDSKSRFSKLFRPQDSGRTVVKVIKPKSSSHKAGTKSANVTIWGYMPLTKLPKVVERGVVSQSQTIQFPGEAADREGYKFFGASGAQARWDTKGLCTSFAASVGIDDTSETGTSAVANFVGENADKSNLTITEGSLLADGDDPELISLKLTKKVGSTTKYARYVDISTQAFSGNPTYYAALTLLRCNLPGGYFDVD